MQGQQLQCPNCTGYKLDDRRSHIRINPQTGLLWKPLPQSRISMLLLAIVILEFIAVPVAHIHLATWVLLLPIILLIVFEIVARNRDNLGNPSKRIVLHRCSCLICGYKWTWREDHAYPPIRNNPGSSSLLMKGAQRLEQEQAAAWYLQDQQRRQRERNP